MQSIPRKITSYSSLESLGRVSYAALKLVKFGFGLSKGGLHTWLFSEGKVYEVHWDQMPSGNLYEAMALNKFMWNSGAIIVPKDQVSKLATLSGLPCSGS